MGLRFIEGREAGTENECVVMFDSVTGCVFGRKMYAIDEAEAFVLWASKERDIRDLRMLSSENVVGLQEEWLGLDRPGYGVDEVLKDGAAFGLDEDD
jgi:hypothetical protein